MASSVYDVLEIIADFDSNIANVPVDRKQTIFAHLQKVDKLNYNVPDFKLGLDWLNVSEALSFSNHLKGHIVILDFFTYCCINCMHLLPDLEAIEEKFLPNSGVVVLGVHSAKFLNEKVTANILSAVLRYNIQHPVVNDKDADLWQALAVACWPTLVFVGPSGQLLYTLAGEGHRSWILEFLEIATDYYSSQLHHDSIPVSLEKDKISVSSLHFPGKVCFWSERKWLVISDTGNHRIVVTDMSGVIQMVIGSGSSGLKDGDFLSAEFSFPQGVTCYKNSIYVADTGNHCIRQIDLEVKSVITIVGTGQQGTCKEGGKKNTDQEIASPWDLILGSAPDEASSPVMFIAMAGTHQIWVYFFTKCSWYHDQSYDAGTCIRFAGSGQEENRNNSYPEKASFAQPSGLGISSKDHRHKLYVADSESSSIRAVSLTNCAVTGLVGAERDPMNLFAYGDVDGKGIQAKLQHPLGVAYLDGKLVVADSYNHKIKLVDLETLICSTFAGTGHPGTTVDKSNLSRSTFNEPGGVAVDETENLIFVADTNNHAIKVINYNQKSIFQLPIIFPTEDELNSSSKIDNTFSQLSENMVLLPDVTLPATSHVVSLSVPLNLSEGTHLNTDAPNSWIVYGLDELSKQLWNSLPSSDQKGKLHSITAGDNSATGLASLTLNLPSKIPPGVYTLRITLQIFLCLDKDEVCLPPVLTHFRQIIRLS